MSAGTYMDVVFSKESNKKLDEIIKSFGLEKDFTDAYHTTIVYSKKEIPLLKTSKGKSQRKGHAKNELSKLVKIKEFGHFDTDDGKNLHVVLDCKFCETQFDRATRAGATSDYDKYTAHITLMYDCGDFTVDDEISAEFIGETLEIVEELITPLNEDWVEESKKDKDK